MDRLSSLWLSLGVAFAGETKEAADPEGTLIETLSVLQEERKFLGLILAWIQEYGDFIHVERIKALAKNLSSLELAWLGGIALHVVGIDKRWNIIVQFAEDYKKKQRRRFKMSKLDELAAKRKGYDRAFKKFGLTIQTVQMAKKTKLLKKSHTLKRHPWLKLRALFGANWRADIAWMMIKRPNQTPYQVAKYLGCNVETAYRNWSSLKDVNAPALLNVA